MLEIEADYITDQHLDILLASHHAANRRRDVGRRQGGQRHLIQEGLESVVILAVHDGDADIGFGKS